ncbi:MAG TPA: S41 family peptidase, partial [Thermoguttaceae bacterium]|nr:S41 family peptidase [Thermoguttaceae bacterium]
DTLDQVERNYVKGITRRELIEAAIDGVLRKLDPYSTYITPDQLDSFRGNIESEFGGIGIQITLDQGRLAVLSPLPNSPAHRAGILAGDRIVEIDGRSTEGVNLDQATERLKGKLGSTVALAVLHAGRAKPETITVTRGKIQLETVQGDHRKADGTWDFMHDSRKGIGYVCVTAFSRHTPEELRRAIESLKKQNVTGLILDLRFNSGGLLRSAIEVSDLFVEKGRIVSTSGRNVSDRVWEARAENTFSGFPMAVLVNRFSASASEIVAACLQDHHRAVVMGERTWGKGSVQNVIPLEHGRSALKLTTASYHRPSGKNIHRFPDSTEKDDWGVKPDEGYEVKLSPADTVTLLLGRRQRDILEPPRDARTKPAGREKREKSESRPVDRALEMAVEYLNSELAKASENNL